MVDRSRAHQGILLVSAAIMYVRHFNERSAELSQAIPRTPS